MNYLINVGLRFFCQMTTGKMVRCCLQVFFLSALGGSTAAESVRIIIRKIATTSVWSKFSMMGQKGKKSMQDMMLLKVIVSKYVQFVVPF